MTRRTTLILTALLALVGVAILSSSVLAASPMASAPAAADAGAGLAKTSRDVCPGLCSYSSIQAAINAAQDGDVIRVAGAPGGLIYAERLAVTKTVQILGGYSGPGPDPWQRNIALYQTVIDGEGAGTVVWFQAGAATLEGFTITGGHAELDGGGILVDGASPLISATVIMSNSAVSSGGGVAIHGGVTHLISDTIMGNTAMGGGGVLIADSADAYLHWSTISNNQAFLFGGGVLVVNSASPTIDACVIRANRAPSGGGVQAFDSFGLISDSQIVQNAAQSGYGGGVNLQNSSVSLEADTIISNTASLDGGGVQVEDSSSTIDGSTVRANEARSGAGLHLLNSLGTLTGNTVSANAALSGSGGGVWLDHSAPVFDGNTVVSNTAAFNGGGIDVGGRYCARGVCDNPRSSRLVNSIIARNSAGQKGAGVYVQTGASPDLANNTIVSNNGEGVFMDAYAQTGITNTIVASNSVGIRALVPSAPSGDYNLLWNNAPGGNYDGMAAGSHDISIDPRFVSPASGDYHLRPDSPAIDAALNAAAPSSDRDGNVRPLVGRCGDQTISDVGAYEFLLDPSTCVTPTATPTQTGSPTATPTRTLTPVASPSPTRTPVTSATPTASATPSSIPTATRTGTPIATTTATRTGTATATRTASRTSTTTPSTTATHTAATTATATASPTQTRTLTATATPSVTATPTETATPTTAPKRVFLPLISANFQPECAAYEMNDTMDQAWGPLIMGVSYRTYLCSYDPVDWYYFDVLRAGALSVDLLVPAKADLDLSVLAADGSIVAESLTRDEGVDEHVIAVLQTVGRYYVRVLPFSRRDASQPYSLTINFF